MSESLTPSVETKKSNEKSESVVDIGYEHLPGNFGFTERIANAIDDKWTAYKTWGQTLGNRMVANAYEETATRHELNFNSYEKRRDALEHKLDAITAAKDRILDSDSILNRFDATRWINHTRAGWKTWRENRLKSKIGAYDGRIQREGSHLRAARASKSVIDQRINRTVERNTKRLDDRLRTAYFHKEKSDTTVVKLEKFVMDNERIVATLENTLESLKEKRRESRRSGDGKADVYQKHMDEVKGKIRELNRELTRGRSKLDRAYGHRVRLENALDIAEATREGIVGRYYNRIAQIARPQNGSEHAHAAVPDTESGPSILTTILEMLAPNLEEKPLSMAEMTKVWNTAFVDAPVKSVTFAEFWNTLAIRTPSPEIQHLTQKAQALPDAMKFKEWMQFLTELYDVSEEFRSFIKTKVVNRTTSNILFGTGNKTDIDIISERLRLVAAHARTI